MDVLLSARRVGPTGFAYGLDMTDEMLELAELNRRETGLANVRFLKGHIEDIPLPADTVDVVISNCVINLSADKGRVLREAFRVLKPGGRLAVSDMVWTRPAPESVRKNADMWAGCVAGALLESDYRSLLADSGFEDVTVTAMRSFDVPGSGCCDESCGSEVRGAGRVGTQDAPLVSAFIRAVKPQG
jgi:ubiquinone/menaquinone biosynthesis C-methylase UbiE